MLDKIYNFINIDFTIKDNYNGTKPLSVNTYCGIDYNSNLNIISPLLKFEFSMEDEISVCIAEFKCNISSKDLTQDENLIKRESLLELFKIMHTMSIGYFTKFNELKVEKQKIYLPAIEYNKIVTNDVNF